MKSQRKLIILLLVFGCFVILASCHHNPFKNFTVSLDSKEIEPSFNITLPENGASFPKNMAAPEFEWEARDNNIWLIRIDLSDGSTLAKLAKENRWVPESDVWENIKKSSENKHTTLTVFGHNGTAFSKSEQIRFRISPYEVDQYVIYRVAHYPFDFLNEKPNLYYRDITGLKSKVFLKADKFCFSCHVLSNEGTAMALSTRKYFQVGEEKIKVSGVDLLFVDKKEKYVLIEDKDKSRNLYASMMSSWSPDNRHLLLAINDSIKKLDSVTENTAYIAYDTTGDIAIYTIEDRSLTLLPGASVQSKREFWPYFSADGKTVSYSRLSKNGESDIYVLPFNDGKGGKPIPLQGASKAGVREYFQRYSPDGKWIIFNRIAGSGDMFCEMTDLYILPAGGGVPKRLACSKEGYMDSVVAWTSNSRWIAFTSRRFKNESRIFFAEIDDQGNAYPPIKMPNQEDKGVGDRPAYHHAYFIKDKRNIQALMDIYNNFNQQ